MTGRRTMMVMATAALTATLARGGGPQAFSARFEQHCAGAVPALRGTRAYRPSRS